MLIAAITVLKIVCELHFSTHFVYCCRMHVAVYFRWCDKHETKICHQHRFQHIIDKNFKTGIEQVHAIANISHSSCCHSNTTRALIANPPNSAQLGDIPYHSPKWHPGPCSSVGTRLLSDTQTDRLRHRQTDRHTDARDHYTFHVDYDLHEM